MPKCLENGVYMAASEETRKPFWTFHRKIKLGVFTTCFTLLIFITSTFFFLKRVMNEENQLISTYAEQLIFAERIQNSVKAQFSIIPIFVLSGKDELISRFEAAHNQFLNLSQKLINISTEESDFLAIKNLRELEISLYVRAHPGIKMRRGGASSQDVHNYFDQTSTISDQLNDAIGNFVRAKTSAFEQAKEKVIQDNNEIVRDVVFVTVAVILACGLSVMLLLRALQEKRLADKRSEILLLQEQRVSQARKDTVEVVAHDLKNPLSTIKMSLELMLESLASQPENKELAQIAYRSTEFMQQLIHSLLDHAKIESGHVHLDLVSSNASLFLDKILVRFKPLANGKGVKLDTLFDTTELPCKIDPVRMEQVFANLLDNAIKFTPTGGIITCQAGLNSQKTAVEFRITDSGPGISEEHQALVFERFWQKRSTAKQGSGLGLAITKAIVEAHGGKISVNSRIGFGTTFIVSIPLELDRYAATVSPPKMVKTSPVINPESAFEAKKI